VIRRAGRLGASRAHPLVPPPQDRWLPAAGQGSGHCCAWSLAPRGDREHRPGGSLLKGHLADDHDGGGLGPPRPTVPAGNGAPGQGSPCGRGPVPARTGRRCWAADHDGQPAGTRRAHYRRRRPPPHRRGPRRRGHALVPPDHLVSGRPDPGGQAATTTSRAAPNGRRMSRHQPSGTGLRGPAATGVPTGAGPLEPAG